MDNHRTLIPQIQKLPPQISRSALPK